MKPIPAIIVHGFTNHRLIDIREVQKFLIGDYFSGQITILMVHKMADRLYDENHTTAVTRRNSHKKNRKKLRERFKKKNIKKN